MKVTAEWLLRDSDVCGITKQVEEGTGSSPEMASCWLAPWAGSPVEGQSCSGPGSVS